MRMLFPQLIKQVGKKGTLFQVGGNKLFCEFIVSPSYISWTVSQEGHFKLIFEGNKAFLTVNGESVLFVFFQAS